MKHLHTKKSREHQVASMLGISLLYIVALVGFSEVLKLFAGTWGQGVLNTPLVLFVFGLILITWGLMERLSLGKRHHAPGLRRIKEGALVALAGLLLAGIYYASFFA